MSKQSISAVPQGLQFRELRPRDNLTGLSLGDKSFVPLKSFLRNCALDFHQHNIAKTYVLVEDSSSPKVWGYLALMCSEVTLGQSYHLEECPKANQYETFAAIKIARLAIDQRLQGGGYGTRMVKWSISLVKEKIMPLVGCRFLIVDAKQNAIPFYEKIGFTLFDTPQNKQSKHPLMFLDLHKTQ
jgi:GNAT superfamily N-acetyltransferase